MNLFQLVLKQMRQRALSTWLTLLSVMLGVALAIVIMLIRRESAALFGYSDYGFDVLVGAKGSPLQLVMNTVYHIDRSPGNIPYSLYTDLTAGGKYFNFARMAIPLAVGDSYKGQRIVGTVPQLFGYNEDISERIPIDRTLEYRPGRRYEIEQGRVFHGRRFEALVGSEIAALTGLKLGDKFQATHGMGETSSPDVHEEAWTVVGVLKPTKTAADRVIFISLPSFYAIGGHSDALEAQAAVRAGLDPNQINQPPEPQSPATKPEDDHDHGDHSHEHDHAPAATAPAGDDHAHDDHAHEDHDHAPTTASTDAHGHADHSHDDHDHAEHDHADPKPATTPAAEEHEHDDHDHHGHAHGAYELDSEGNIIVTLPKEKWSLSSVLVKSRSGPFGLQLMYVLNNRNEASAVNPASVMREFFNKFLKPATAAWGAVAYLVNLVAIVAILVSIYNSVSARLRDIAILRALGATRAKILAVICLEAGLIGFVGGVLGLVLGHGLGAAASGYLDRAIGETIRWWTVSPGEILYLLAVTAVAVLAGLVPALKAYRSPVAGNLVGGIER